MVHYKQFGLILAAAGKSSRFGEQDKLLIELKGKNLFLHALNTFSKVLPADNIVIVVSQGQESIFRQILNEQGFCSNISIVPGGQERQHSVLNGLSALNSKRVQFAAVHDAARPYITEGMIRKTFDYAKEFGNAVLAKEVTDTIKIIDENNCVVRTPARALLRAAETPQVFPLEMLKTAYQSANGTGDIITDESMAAEKQGQKVHIVAHQGNNNKVTYSHDL